MQSGLLSSAHTQHQSVKIHGTFSGIFTLDFLGTPYFWQVFRSRLDKYLATGAALCFNLWAGNKNKTINVDQHIRGMLKEQGME